VTVTLTADGALYLDGAASSLDAIGVQLAEIANSNRLAVIIASDRDARVQPLIGVLDALKRAGIPAAAIIARPQT